MDEMRYLEKEIAELRDKLNETVGAVNNHTQYLAEQRKLHSQWWHRFMMWVVPEQMPVYREPPLIKKSRKGDRPPVVRNMPPIEADEPFEEMS